MPETASHTRTTDFAHHDHTTMTSGLQEFPANFGASPRFPTSEPLTGLDALAAESHFAQQRQQQQLSLQHQQQALALAPPRQDRTLQPSTVEVAGSEGRKSKKELGATQKPAKTSSGPVRRRISRACDQCNQLRTKCDGEFPCAHCKEYGLTCEYARERKKRGKASRKELATQDGNQQDAAANLSDSVASVTTPLSSKSGSELPRIAAVTSEPHNVHAGVKRRRSGMSAVGHETTSETNFRRTNDGAFAVPQHPATANASNPRAPSVADSVGHMQPNSTSYGPGSAPAGSMYQSHNPRLPFGSVDFSAMDGYHRSVLQHSANVNGQNVLHANNSFPAATSHLPQYPSNQYVAPSPPSQAGGSLGQIRYSDSPASGRGPIANSPHGNSPAWLDLPSPSASLYASLQQTQTQQNLRYPVLRQILPRISSIIPISLACDLLDIYFASSSSTFVRPASPYILGFVLRKRSVLRQTEPRQCSPALLASMLWVAAQTSESSYLTSPPSQRGKICHQLLELTLALFKPLVHTSASDQAEPSTRAVANGVAIGGFGIANPAAGHDTEGGSPGATAALDDVITYINLATVISASEYKAASLRWWNAAWSLARELKLGRELTPNPPQEPNQNGIDVNDGNNPFQNGTANRSSGPHFSEEVREERRRIWWLLYIVDRHLALCYNRPLFLMDVECEGLLQPEDDSLWQLDEFYNPPQFRANIYSRVGPGFECIGHSMFGYFLPLMTMLGEVVDIKHAKQHPRFGLRFRNPENWLDQVTEVNSQLEAYGRSLKDFEDRFVNSAQAAQNAPDLASPPFGAPNQLTSAVPIPRMTETALQTRIVVAYGTHLMHTLHVLAHTKWDPIDLLDDNDQWISSGASFIDATGHAVAAADAINDILEYDPDLSFMPFFFGIYLLQGSFLLLLIADKLGGQASEAVVRACEAIVRAHEVCVVTLNTEYQRNFRNVMRSALAQVKGRTPIDFGERGQRRREVLALYRWTGDGTGLAL